MSSSISLINITVEIREAWRKKERTEKYFVYSKVSIHCTRGRPFTGRWGNYKGNSYILMLITKN